MNDIAMVALTLVVLRAVLALRPGLRAGLREGPMSFEHVVGLLLSRSCCSRTSRTRC